MAVRDRSACSPPVSSASSRDYVWSPEHNCEVGWSQSEKTRPDPGATRSGSAQSYSAADGGRFELRDYRVAGAMW